ncbi:hypothetical protein XENOCAPTIV_006274, partial [Xenoophorus captivus]
LTPHTTGVASSEMLLGRRPKSHLDLLQPDLERKVAHSQDKQIMRGDQHSKERLSSQVAMCMFGTMLLALLGNFILHMSTTKDGQGH